MENLCIIDSAIERMWQLSRDCDTETGGLLIGTTAVPLIMAAGAPGNHSIRKATFFQSDPEQDKLELRKARRLYGDVLQPVGYWHKHPQGISQPSRADLQQAQQILASWRPTDFGKTWLVCVIMQNGKDPVAASFPYKLIDPKGSFSSTKFQVISECDPLAAKALSVEPVKLTSNIQTHPWVDPGFRFQFTASGKIRLEKDIEALNDLGYKAEIRQRKSDNHLSIFIHADDKSYMCLLPREYPFGMPRIFQHPGGEELYPLERYHFWNSELSLADWVEGSIQQPQSELAAATQTVQATSPGANVNPINRRFLLPGLCFSVLIGLLMIKRLHVRVDIRRQK